MPAVFGLTTPSIAEASSGSSKRYGPRVQVMSMSSGSRVLREGTIAMSSKPYALRPFLPRPISTSIGSPYVRSRTKKPRVAGPEMR